MKKIVLYILTLSFLTTCDVKPSVTSEGHSSTALSAILDITDPRKSWPKADQLLLLYHCKQNPDAECLFRLRTISDKRLTPILSYRLANTESMEKDNRDDDPQFRYKNILAFYGIVRKTMNDFYELTDTAQSQGNSEVFRVIADELTFLAGSKSSERILVIASDLMEKSDLFDSYTSKYTSPDQIAAKLAQANLLPKSLAGITIIFLFNPRDRKEDISFSSMGEAYKILFKNRAAEIKIQANLNLN